MKGFVYIIKSLKDDKYYIGSTINWKKRLKEHNRGYVGSTKNRKPFVVEYILEYENISEASVAEKKFKRSHGALLRELKKRGLAQG